MATSPTVLVGSTSTSSSAPTTDPKKNPLAPLLVAVLVGLLIAVLGLGSVVYYFVRFSRLPNLGAAPSKAEDTALPTTHIIVLEPLLVNLADDGGNSYFRVSLTLRVADAATKKTDKAKGEKPQGDGNNNEIVAAARDTALTVLGRQTVEGLLSSDGKAQLKSRLKAALGEHNPDLKITDVYFTEFLVQR